MLIGYARVSTADQTLALQQDALETVGCDRLFTDTASGARAERLALSRLSPMPGKATSWSSGGSIGWGVRSST